VPGPRRGPGLVDELAPVARVTGLAGVERRSFTHALNLRAVARRFAAERGRALADLRLVGVHSARASRSPRSRAAGWWTSRTRRTRGRSPATGRRRPGHRARGPLLRAGSRARALKRRLFGDGGLFAHLGTRDVARGPPARAEAATPARRSWWTRCATRSRSRRRLAAALEGRVDAVLLTGGMAHLAPVVEAIRRRVAWIAPVHVSRRGRAARARRGRAAGRSGEEPARSYAGR